MHVISLKRQADADEKLAAARSLSAAVFSIPVCHAELVCLAVLQDFARMLDV